MSQHDYNIANQLFPDTRVDWNAVLLAIATSNSGPAMPATTFGSMVAYNETDDVFYMRNKGNTAWVAMGKIVSDKWYPYLDGAQLGQGTDAVKGIWEKANAAEAAALSSDVLVLTPLMLASVLCSESALGLARFGTTAEVETGTAADRALSVLQFGRTWKEGGAIASATTLVEPTDANKGGVYSLTGSVTVANLWAGETPGRKVQLRLTGTPQFTNSATLIIPGGTRTFAAGDVLEFTAEAANVWRLTGGMLANGKSVVESVPSLPSGNAKLIAVATKTTWDSTTNIIPTDNTVPQISQGKETLTVVATPTNASATHLIKVTTHLGHSSAQLTCCAALFVDAVANAIGGGQVQAENATMTSTLTFSCTFAPGSLTARTYRLRFGPAAAGTCGLNGDSSGQMWNGALVTIIEVWEIAP